MGCRMWRVLPIIALLIAACGDDGSSSERACEAASGCGALEASDIASCVAALDEVDAERALAECADCLEAQSCAAIASGSCDANCAPFSSAFDSGSGISATKLPADLTDEELRQFCEWAVERQGGPGRQVTCNESTVTTMTVAECADWLETATCQRRMGDYEACFAAVDPSDVCTSLTEPACQAISNC